MNKKIMLLAICTIFLASCTSAPPKPVDTQPHLNGLPVSAIYYDDTEDPVGYGKYHAFLFLLLNDQFVILRNRDKIEFVLSNIEKLEAKYPSARHPIKFSRNGNLISGSMELEFLESNGFRPHVYRKMYEGNFQGNTIHLKSSSSRVYPDGREKKDEDVAWDFRKLREY